MDMKNNEGFTLIELILVVCIISIVSFIAILDGNILSNYKEKQELNEFINDLNYARNNAIIESKIYFLELKLNENYYIVKESDKKEGIIKEKRFTNGIKIISTNLPGNLLTFYPTGAVRNAGTINLKNSKGEKIQITIGVATGKIRVYFK